ncbi:MAG TPA: hypothetical protein VK166_20200 [Chitinophagaceae bacterium]|nr:hypothetical protein [Chitinophagaceae bacterium]
MKKLTCLLLFAATWFNSFSQIKDTAAARILKEDYLNKSKRQRTTGFVLLGIGAALTITGVLVINNNSDNPLDPNDVVNTTAGAGVFLIGAISSVASIPFFISSVSNKKKAMKLSTGFKMEKLRTDKMPTPLPSYYPAVTARIRL